MKKIILIAILCGLFPAFAAEDTKTVGQYTFELNNNAWIMTGITDSVQIEPGYAVKYKDEAWEKWYNSGDEILKQILDLGPNLLFKMKSSQDQQEHVFSVSEDGVPVMGALTSGSGSAASSSAASKGLFGLSKVGTGLVAAGVVAGAVIVANDDDDEGSSTKR